MTRTQRRTISGGRIGNISARLLLGVLISSLVGIGMAHAQEEEAPAEPPRRQFQVGLDLEEEYNDNVFLVSDGKTFDYITRVSIPIVWSNEAPRWRADLSYRPSYEYFVRKTSDNELRHTATLAADMTLARNLAFFELTDTFERVDLDTRRTTTDVSTFVDQSDRNTLTVHPYLRHRMGRTGLLEAGYTYTNIHYFEDTAPNRQAHDGNASFSTGLTRTTTGSIYYRYHRELVEEATDLSNFTSHDGGLGLQFRFSANAELSLNGGVTYIDFDRADSGYDYHFGGDLSLRHAATVTSSLSAVQDYSVDARDGAFRRRRGDYVLSYDRRFSLSASVFFQRSEFLEISRDDDTYGTILDFSRPVGRNLALGLNGEWRRNRYEPETEELDRWRGRVSLDWNIGRETTVGVAYQYTDNDSSIPENDYRSNIARATVRTTF